MFDMIKQSQVRKRLFVTTKQCCVTKPLFTVIENFMDKLLSLQPSGCKLFVLLTFFVLEKIEHLFLHESIINH